MVHIFYQAIYILGIDMLFLIIFSRIEANVKCDVDFEFYPFDVIECNIQLSLGKEQRV